MTQKITVSEEELRQDRSKYCFALEKGNILFWPSIPFIFPMEDIEFLLLQRQGGSSLRKNIAYKPTTEKITNHDTQDEVGAERLRGILKNLSCSIREYLSAILSPYAEKWQLDYASFRPFQEKGRKLRTRARNDLLHVDSFATRPVGGKRILRFFINIHPTESRQWITSKPFSELLSLFSGEKKLRVPRGVDYSWKSYLQKWSGKALSFFGGRPRLRSPYDAFMLRMHHFMKENRTFQETCDKDSWSFPPYSCWAVFTDQVSHAVLSGQYALEQTFLIPQEALLCPETSPASVLQRVSGKNLL